MGIGMAAWRGGNRRWVWLTAGVVVVLVLVAGVVWALTADADEKPVAAATTVAVDKGAVTSEVATTGTLQPAQTRNLSFTVAGTVESVKVRAGTVVTAGQDLASIGDDDAATTVDEAQDTLADAQDALTEAQDAAAEATSTPTTSTTGCVAPAAYADPAPSASSSATASPTPSRTSTSPTPAVTTKPTTKAPTKAPARTTNPARGGGAAPTTKSNQNCTTTTGGGSTGGGSTGGGNTSGGQQGGGQGSGGDAVLSAQQRVNQAEVALENAEDNLDGTTITAPIAGRILSVSGKVGSQVSSGSTFIALADVYDMQVSADFPEADADRLAVRQKATIGLADRAGDTLGATVVQVDPIGTSDGTLVRYGVVLSFDDAPKDLLVGQSASVRVTTGSAQDVLRVPSTAVHDVAGDSGTVLRDGAQVKVVIGLRGDQYTEIKSGLTEGEAVVRSW
ncbi:efflux RND transporter periplasmic adaptor subunit [Winogradskya humida]|uniref:HlyD family secretion protein n=1 Tax=Winogradskya humida TaxID=113566 RepID=A0ABQ3ZZI8_9ACTN|nr:HlyD family efflux transporter periplasmic adaptor subunit [Actinoplanes humidus]GIE23988.1 hypothetical protein Ahu01nite_070900 [Actinoplanes humidus]